MPTFTGTEGNDTITPSGGGSWDVFALGGDDTINITVPIEGFAVDIFVDGGNGFDFLNVAPIGRINGTGNPDEAFLSGSSSQSANLSWINVERVSLTGAFRGTDFLVTGASEDWLNITGTVGSGFIMRIQTNGGNDRIIATGIQIGSDIDVGTGDDIVDISGATPSSNPLFIVRGGDGNDSLTGSSANDQLFGDAGNDTLVAGNGTDQMRGGAGDDVYVVDSLDSVFETAGEGFDIVRAGTSFTLSTGQSIERLAAVDPAATGAFTLTGNEIANEIIGNAGNNRLDGLGGVDRLEGDLGNDIYFVDPGDVVVEAVGQGLDYVYARATYALAAGVEAEVFATADYRITTRIDLTGNEFNNSITGSEGINTLRGGGGDDTLKGLGGNDVLDGNAGLDYLFGGVGNDIYYVDTGDNVNEAAGEGSDAVYARSSFILMTNSHVETLATADYRLTNALDLTGSALANNISGNNGVNVLSGGGGNDSLSGLDGNDILEGGTGKDNMSGGAGIDTFRFTSALQSTVGTADELLDFVSGTDKIDLVLIDARSGTPGDDAFTYIGTNAFSNTAGELRAQAFGSTIHIFGDVNGDSVADFEIIANTTTIAAGDFVF